MDLDHDVRLRNVKLLFIMHIDFHAKVWVQYTDTTVYANKVFTIWRFWRSTPAQLMAVEIAIQGNSYRLASTRECKSTQNPCRIYWMDFPSWRDWQAVNWLGMRSLRSLLKIANHSRILPCTRLQPWQLFQPSWWLLCSFWFQKLFMIINIIQLVSL